MSQSIAVRPHRFTGAQWGRRQQLLLGALLGLIFGVLGLAALAPRVDAVASGFADRIAAHAVAPAPPVRELPPEWRWEPREVDYRGMYRRQDSPRLDWIRAGARR